MIYIFSIFSLIILSIVIGGYLTLLGYSFHTKPHKSLTRYANSFLHLDNKYKTEDYNSSFKLDNLYLYISKKNYTRIEQLRKVASENNYLESSSKIFYTNS